MLRQMMLHRGWLTQPRRAHHDAPPRPSYDRARDFADALRALHAKPTRH